MSKYLLLKLAEEAGEVVVAAIKHRLHNTASTRRQLEAEIGDVLAIIALLMTHADIDNARCTARQGARYNKELKRMKGRHD